MKLNTKVRYGLRAMIDIAIHSKNTGVFQKDIAQRQDIPVKYMDKIVVNLKTAGLICNAGGKRSGYILVSDSSSISVYDIYKAAEGEICVIECLNEKTSCCKKNTCASREFWSFFNDGMKKVLETTMLDSLVAREHQLNNTSENIEFHI